MSASGVMRLENDIYALRFAIIAVNQGSRRDMTRISIATVAALLCVPALALELEFGTAPTGDGGRGFGILAEYGAGGPKTITITRTTLPGFPKPNYWTRWGRLCNLTVYDPDGFSAAYLEMGDQSAATETYTLKVPEGKAGVWRVSVSGGLAPSGRFGGDTFKIVMPDSACWGVRGAKSTGCLFWATSSLRAWWGCWIKC